MKVNLSRIHKLIEQTSTEIRNLTRIAAQPLQENGEDFEFQILDSTTDEDMRGFLNRLNARKEQISQRFQECRRLLEYSFYLRRQMDAANRSSGIGDKLLELNNIKKMLSQFYTERQTIAMSCSQGLDELKEANYYKASFTEKQKVYNLAVRMFSQKDYAKILAEIDATEKKAFDVSNDIAFLNQTTVIDILSFDEFKKQK